MKLNQDCVRAVLLELEEKLTLNDDLYFYQIKQLDCIKKFGEDTVIYSILKLIEARYLLGEPLYAGDELMELTLSALTWDGHLFLDTIRDNKVWKETKSVVSKFSSVSISLMSTIASTILNELVKKQLGF
ncbi:DUF2513 domain-containing protein [Lysinibacillus sp. 1 U-2021]|uniref:DUF2513 domain-containing protein n=1 Tax=Lysinibacillus sp. 1 U-2021 TaxID=3039426 RepID=UPI00247FFC61|nr:DUF2513 domain-containing protein [Lysinibacillus sp. 1 U-2021]WGT38537.1 DUF2513 domain-containing protein [Lysinibacillus sp. 1 U-2021]